MADQLETALLDQYTADENASVDAMTDAVSQSFGRYAPGAEKVVKDVAGGASEILGLNNYGGGSLAGALPRLVRGMLGTVESGIAAMPGSDPALDAIDGVIPDWWRKFAAGATDVLDYGASFGADPQTVTGHLGKTGVDLALNLLILRKLGAFSTPGKIVKGSSLAKTLIPVAQESGQIGMVSFLLAGDEKALARQTRDNLVGFLKDHPEFQDVFLQTMTSEDPDKDALLAQSVDALQSAGLTAGLLWVAPAFRSFRRFLGRQMTVEEAAKEFGLSPGSRFKQREIPQKWAGSEPTTVREIGPVEEGAIGKAAPSGGIPANMIARYHAQNGGSSFSQTGKNLAEGTGFSASMQGFEQRVKGVLTETQINQYAQRPDVAEVLKKNPEAYVGTWFDQKTGEHVLDVSKTFQREADARQFGTANKQQAIWDFGNKKEIPLGGGTAQAAPFQLASGSKGWLTNDGKVVLADSHEATAEGFAKQYGLIQGEAAHDALKKGFIRWDAQHQQFHMETFTSPEALARARTVLESAPDKKTYIVDLSSEGGATEFFQTNTKEEALKKLDYFTQHGELPRRSRIAQYLDETVPGGPNQSIVHDLTQAAEEAKGRLRLKINRLGVNAGMIEPENLKDITTIGASLLARGITGKRAWNEGILGLAAERAAEAKLDPAKTEDLLNMVKSNLDSLRTRSEDSLARNYTSLAPNFKQKMSELENLFNAGKDRFDWYHNVQDAVSRIGTKEDQKTFVGFIAALSPLNNPSRNVEQALTAFHRFRMINPRTDKQWSQVVDGLGLSSQRDTIKRLKEAANAAVSGKDTAIEDTFLTSDPMYQKVNSFYRNLWHSVDRPDEVTVDSWMFQALGIEERQKAQTYNIVREVVRQEAKKYNMQPHEFQASLWTGLHRTMEPGDYKVLGSTKTVLASHIGQYTDKSIRDIIQWKIDQAIKSGHFRVDGDGKLVPQKPPEKIAPTMKEMIDKILGNQQRGA